MPNLELSLNTRLVVNSNGEFAINKTSPSAGYDLDVNGNVNIGGDLVFAGSLIGGVSSFT